MPEYIDKEQKLELLNKVKDALDFQFMVLEATGGDSISLKKDHAYICFVAIEQLIKKIEGEDNGTK